MTMENQPFPIENGDVPVSHVGRELGRVYPLKNAGWKMIHVLLKWVPLGTHGCFQKLGVPQNGWFIVYNGKPY